MKNAISLLAILLLTSTASQAYAADALKCQKNQDSFSATEGKHMGNGPTLHGFKNSAGKIDLSADKLFLSLLTDSHLCVSLSLYLGSRDERSLLCDGEFIALNAIYGQVILSKGALESLTAVIAPAAGWTCSYTGK